MPRAPRRNQGRNGGRAPGRRGRQQQHSPKKYTANDSKKKAVALPAYCPEVRCAVPCELALEPKLAVLAILNYLAPRPVAADMQPAATKSIFDFICGAPATEEHHAEAAARRAGICASSECLQAISARVSAAAMHEEDFNRESLLQSLQEEAYFQGNPAHCIQVVDALMAMRAEAEHACPAAKLVSFPRGPNHVMSCRGLLRLVQNFIGFHEPNLMTVCAIKKIQVIVDWSLAKVLYCLQGSCGLTDKEIASRAMEQAFGRIFFKYLNEVQQNARSPDMNTSEYDTRFSRFLLMCQLHGAHLSLQTAKHVYKGVNALVSAIIRHCAEYLGSVWHGHECNQKKGYRWNTLHLKQMLDFDDNFKAFLEPFWQDHTSLGVSHTVHNGEFMSVMRYFPSSTLRMRSTSVLEYINTSASYSIVDVAQHTLLLLMTGRASSAIVSNSLNALQQTSSTLGIKAPPSLAIYIVAIQSVCTNGCAYKIMLPESFRSMLAAEMSSSGPLPSNVCSVDSSLEIIQFFCGILADSSNLVRRMTPSAQRECSDLLKTFVASHRVRNAVRKSVLDDSVESETLKNLETSLNSTVTDSAKHAILATFLKSEFTNLFPDFPFYPKLLESVAANMFSFHESVETMIGHFATHEEMNDEIIASLNRIALDVNDSWKSAFDSATSDQQKQMLGERIYVAVASKHPELSSKITRMIIDDLDIVELLSIVDSPVALDDRIEFLVKILRNEHVARITMKPPPALNRLLPYVCLVNEFDMMPGSYVPMSLLVISNSSLFLQSLFVIYNSLLSGHVCVACQSARIHAGTSQRLGL
jgi:hypothetical protein